LPPEDHNNGTTSRQEPPRLLGDRYDLVEVIGSGASAITWRGHDRRLDRAVAIKVLRRDQEQDAAYVQRFEREARLSASISDAHVVQVFDVGQQDGWLYLVMQFVDGEDLKRYIDRRGPLPTSEARDIARQILEGLATIHRAGILHRDIKSQNVLIDHEGRVRVTDFGIAQTSLDPSLTSAGLAVGTAAYMAPEQAEAGPLSEATDIYAVGVVLYEMLTGRLPFERPTATATMLAHINEVPVPPSQAAPSLRIPPLLDGVVLQAMAKSPGNRFRSANAMSRALAGNFNDPGATTKITLPPEQQATRVAARPRQQPSRPPVTYQQQPVARPAQRKESGGGRWALNFMLVVILLAMVVVAAYLATEYLRDRENVPSGTDNPTPTPTVEVESTEPPPIEQATEPIIAPPTEEPTEEPTPTTEPTATSEPTELPVEPATAEATEDIPIIEPADRGGS
jgi:serine/threonine-protein kinase